MASTDGERPSFSVVVPAYNTEKFIRDALDSIDNQTYRPIEIIMVDDGSTDDTLATARSWSSRSGIRTNIVAQCNSGAGAARNAGIRAASGSWIAFLDSDDVYMPDALETFANAASCFPTIRWLGADFSEWDASLENVFVQSLRDRQRVRTILEPAFQSNTPMIIEDSGKVFLDVILTWTGVVAARRDLLLEVGGFNENLREAQDIHLWIRLGLITPFLFIPKRVACYRRREGSTTNSNRPPRGGAKAAYRALVREGQVGSWSAVWRRRMAEFDLQDAGFYITRRVPHLALWSILKSISYGSWNMTFWSRAIRLTARSIKKLVVGA